MASSARAEEPWADADPPEKPARIDVGDYGFRIGAEYRSQWVHVAPIALNNTTNRKVDWIEQRFRFDVTADWKDVVKIVTTIDLLDGVLWGDNGDFGGNPSSNTGTNINSKYPNVSRPCITFKAGDPLSADGYAYGLCEADPVKIRKLYGEVALPFGVLRVGRMPVNVGMGVQANDGEGRPNRFGISRNGNFADRILFGTKPLEVLKPPDLRNKSENEGLIVGLVYDRIVNDDPQKLDDDVHAFAYALRYLQPKHPLGTDLLASAYHAYRWDRLYGSKIHSFGMRAMSHFGDLYAGFDLAFLVGTTREVAEGYKFITNDPVVDQKVRQVGARGVVRWDQPLFSLYLEADYASGDPDPNARTPLTQFVFAEDTNVGLLMFEHVLAYQTGRAAAAGNEILRRLGARTNPAEVVNTRGSFTNAIAIFPQVDVRPHPDWLIRAGVLMAWADSPVYDPIASLQARDGLTIDDDLVNFAGGKPGRYYGTEIDARIRWRYEKHFNVDLEGAVLFPGEAFHNENGKAVRSLLVQARTTFYF